jgi:hypothetical protein
MEMPHDNPCKRYESNLQQLADEVVPPLRFKLDSEHDFISWAIRDAGRRMMEARTYTMTLTSPAG